MADVLGTARNASAGNANERIFSILFDEDDLTWQNIIYDLIETNQMDPWDVNVSLLAQKFLEKLRELKEMDFRISGKIVLAAAILVKIKSKRLVTEDIAALDSIIAGQADDFDILDEIEGFGLDALGGLDGERQVLRPRTPQPRKRKVSVYDLMEALQKALSTEDRRKRFFVDEPVMRAPLKTRELSVVIKEVYTQVRTHFDKNVGVKLMFHQLVPSDSKDDKVFTFVPLLHLENQRRVDLSQEEHFGPIEIALSKALPDVPDVPQEVTQA
ncbi:MAG: ScpA family protein [Nanoarchaeota archaeon]